MKACVVTVAGCQSKGKLTNNILPWRVAGECLCFFHRKFRGRGGLPINEIIIVLLFVCQCACQCCKLEKRYDIQIDEVCYGKWITLIKFANDDVSIEPRIEL